MKLEYLCKRQNFRIYMCWNYVIPIILWYYSETVMNSAQIISKLVSHLRVGWLMADTKVVQKSLSFLKRRWLAI